MFFDCRVLRDDQPTDPEPVYPGQSGGSVASDIPPLVYQKGKTGDADRFGKKLLRTAVPRVAGRPGSADLRTPEEKESKVLPIYSVRQDVPHEVQGHGVPTAEQHGPQPDQAGTVQQEPLYAAQQSDAENQSLLPRDMPPPPQLEQILTAVPTPGEGNRLFSSVACAMMIQREGVRPEKMPSRRRATLTKVIRKNAFQLGISLTYKVEAEQIFGFLLQEGQQLGEMLEELRHVLESFLDKEKQQAVPAKYSEQFQELPVLFPQFLAMAIDSDIFVYTEGLQSNLERIQGFKTLLEREHSHPAVVIQHDGLGYSATTITRGYDEIFEKFQERLPPEDSYVPQQLIEQVLQIVHYLYNQEATREYV